MANVPYPLTSTDVITFNGQNTNGYTGLTTSGLATLDNFNQYRNDDKLVSRVLIYIAGSQMTQALNLHYADVRATAASAYLDLPLKATFSGFTLLGSDTATGIPQRSILDYNPNTPILVRSTDAYSLVLWFSHDATSAVVNPKVAITIEFQYVNRSGTPAQNIYQG